MRQKSKMTRFLIFIVLVLLVILSATIFENAYLLISFIVLALLLLLFFLSFESKIQSSRYLVLLAMLAAIASISRIPFAAIPSVQPTTFFVIITGLTLGVESGFVVGALAALISNLFLGQGPWTPWQMIAWGLAGASAGLFRHILLNKRFILLSFGAIWGILFGWIMNLWFILGFLGSLSWATVITYYAASIYFDLSHSIANVLLLLLFAAPFIKMLERIKLKYGLTNR